MQSHGFNRHVHFFAGGRHGSKSSASSAGAPRAHPPRRRLLHLPEGRGSVPASLYAEGRAYASSTSVRRGSGSTARRASSTLPFFVQDNDGTLLALLKKWLRFGYIGLWMGQCLTTDNERLLCLGFYSDSDSDSVGQIM